MKRTLEVLSVALILLLSGCELVVNEVIILDVEYSNDKLTCQLLLTYRSGRERRSELMNPEECSRYQKGDIIWVYKSGRVKKIQK